VSAASPPDDESSRLAVYHFSSAALADYRLPTIFHAIIISFFDIAPPQIFAFQIFPPIASHFQPGFIPASTARRSYHDHFSQPESLSTSSSS
jgi:hypothetical protein